MTGVSRGNTWAVKPVQTSVGLTAAAWVRIWGLGEHDVLNRRAEKCGELAPTFSLAVAGFLGSWCWTSETGNKLVFPVSQTQGNKTQLGLVWGWGAKNENNKIFYPQNIELMCSSGGAAFNQPGQKIKRIPCIFSSFSFSSTYDTQKWQSESELDVIWPLTFSIHSC